MDTRNIRVGLLGVFMVALGSLLYSQSTPATVGIQASGILNGSLFQEGYGLNLGVFRNNLEFSGALIIGSPGNKGGIGEVAYVSKDIGRFLQFGGGVQYTKYKMEYFVSSNNEIYGAKVNALGALMVSRYRIYKNLNAEMKLGVTYFHLKSQIGMRDFSFSRAASTIQLGLNYQFYLKGKRDTTPGIQADYFDGGKLAFNYRFGSQISSFLNLGGVLNGGEHHFSASYKVNQWLHPYVGGIFGPWYSAYRDTVDLPFAFKGIEIGARAYTVQREHWAIYQDVSYGFVKRPNINLFQSRFSMGNFFSVKLHPALRANAGLLLNFYDQDVLVEMSAGLSVVPFFKSHAKPIK